MSAYLWWIIVDSVCPRVDDFEPIRTTKKLLKRIFEPIQCYNATNLSLKITSKWLDKKCKTDIYKKALKSIVPYTRRLSLFHNMALML